MHNLSDMVDDFVHVVLQDNSVNSIMNRLAHSDNAEEHLDAAQDSLHAIANRSHDFVTAIHHFSTTEKNEPTVTRLRDTTAGLVRAIIQFKNAFTHLRSESDTNHHPWLEYLGEQEQPVSEKLDLASVIATEKVRNALTLDATELKIMVDDAKQTHVRMARRVNRFSAMLEWESAKLEEA